MNVEEKVKNECLKIYNDILEQIVLLTPFMNKMKDSDKNIIDKEQIDEIQKIIRVINIKSDNIKRILDSYDLIELNIKEIQRYWNLTNN